MRIITKVKISVLNFLAIVLFNPSFAQKQAEHFKADLDFGGGTVISTFLDLSAFKDQFKISSPKNADVRIMGSKAKLGRLLGKSPKKGIIVTIKGDKRKDSLFGSTKIPMFGKLKFKGSVKNGNLSGELLNDAGTAIGKLHGIVSKENKNDYQQLYPKIITTVKTNIYSASALKNKEWENFQKKLKSLCEDAHDDVEIFIGFSVLAQKLPFTHLYLLIGSDTASSEEPASVQKSVVFEEKNNNTAYLQIKNFSSSQEELAAILPKIVANPAYKNLIIDLRNNGGGGVGPAFELAKYITTEDMEVGYFPTNKLQYSGYQPELFNALAEVQPKSTDEFGSGLRTSPGAKLIFKKPDNPVFNGQIYVLTNGNTGSTCEPMVYALKKNKKAVIIGERTAGAMLAASPYVVSGKYLLMLPIADFYTNDGVRLDKVGVEPNVKVESHRALDKAMEIIQTNH